MEERITKITLKIISQSITAVIMLITILEIIVIILLITIPLITIPLIIVMSKATIKTTIERLEKIQKILLENLQIKEINRLRLLSQ